MQYLLTEEEFKNSVPASAVEPFMKALVEYYQRKNDHLGRCLESADQDFRGLRNGINGAIERHHREWTEKPPEPKDFLKT